MVTGKATPKLTGLDTVRGAIDIIEQYFENGWTDGLPIVPPTQDLVDSMMDLQEGTCDKTSFRVASAVSFAVYAFRTGNTCPK